MVSLLQIHANSSLTLIQHLQVVDHLLCRYSFYLWLVVNKIKQSKVIKMEVDTFSI